MYVVQKRDVGRPRALPHVGVAHGRVIQMNDRCPTTRGKAQSAKSGVELYRGLLARSPAAWVMAFGYAGSISSLDGYKRAIL